MIDINGLSFFYGDAEEEATKKSDSQITDINLHIHPGECVLLCGGSGCGKTTLTKTVNGLIPHFEAGTLTGSVSVDTHEVEITPMYALAKIVSSVFQNPKSQFFNTDAESEITFALENQGVAVSEINQRLTEVIAELHIEHLLAKSLFAMSGGEKQIIAFAGAYLSGAKVVVLDEPSANLDTVATQKIKTIMEKMKVKGQTILIAEHRISYLLGLVDRVCYMQDGKIIKEYSAKEFYAMPEQKRIELGLRQLTQEQITTINRVKPNLSATVANTLEVHDVSLSYGNCPVATNISFTVNAGDIVGIVGKNGAGKSTLSRFLCGLHEQTQGKILLNGKEFNKKARRKSCGIVMQDVNYQLFSDSVFGECLLGNHEISNEKVEAILTELGLLALRNAHPQSLSGGQKQRLAIAAALASDKQVLILDEPTSGLDYKNMVAVSNLLHRLAENGVLCMVVTHDTEFLRAACNRCLRLEANGIVEIKAVETIL